MLTSEHTDATLEVENENDLSNKNTQLHTGDDILDVELVGEEFKQIGGNKIDIKALVLSCVQAALSTVKDRNGDSSRETDRVTLILKLIDGTEGIDNSFLHGLSWLIVTMLEAKELESVLARSEDWVVFEASNLDSISRTGTLRRSCSRILENKVAPILARIIAFLDTNCNLDLMDTKPYSWKHDLWLAILYSPEALGLQHTDLKLKDNNEVIVKTTGYEGHMFNACMPFSWLFISQISEILRVELKQPTEEGVEDNVMAESCSRILQNHPLFVILNEITQGSQNDEIFNDYVHDFVHCVYNPGTHEEHMLVSQSLTFATRKMTNISIDLLIHSLVCVHIAHEYQAPRLALFRAINNVFPECGAAIIEMKEKQPDHFMFQEFEFTYPATCVLIEKLTPLKAEIDQDQGRGNWLRKVYKYRPVVEKVISFQREETPYSAASLRTLQRARELWNRVVVVKLFLENICSAESKSKITVKYCMPLWTTLGEETDMKQMKSFGKVERFLKSCNKGAIKEYIGAEEKCSHCERMLDGPPITLPCNDVVCDECYEDVKALGKYECTKCHQIVPPGFRFERRIAKSDVHDKLRDYQKRCNTFFMDVVSQLCFANNAAPSPEVVDRLLGYVFFKTSGENIRTKDMSIFNTGIDPNPVFRSYLLQLLIRTHKDSICENLEIYIDQAKNFISESPAEQESHCIELSLLIIQCLEDMFNEHVADFANENEEIEFVIRSLRSAKDIIDGLNLSARKLYSLASARMGLAKAAKYIARVVARGVGIIAVPVNIKRVIEAAQILFEETNAKWTKIYLVKNICRCYGVDIYRSLCRSKASLLRWIPIKNMNIEKVVEVSDRYVVCGNPYVTIREAVTKVVLGEPVDPLIKILTELQTAGVNVGPLFTLAVHREVTSSYLYTQQQRKLTEKVLTSFVTLFEDSEMLDNKMLLRLLAENQMVPMTLRYDEGEDMLRQGIKCVIVHFQSVFSHLEGDRTLLKPLITLMTRPESCINWFLPTMPQDDLEDVKVALLAARNQRGADANPVFYRCPNGHPYYIGNCGRAIEKARCRECGAEIGGLRHRVLEGNTKDIGIDRTEMGHILGQPAARSRDPKPERLLTPTCCATLRCLLHIAMYLGIGKNVQGVQNLIKTGIEEERVEQFIWQHIEMDIHTLRKAINRSTDDVLLFIHLVIDYIFNSHHRDAEVSDEILQLRSKQGRSKWEELFCSKFVQHVLKTLDEALKSNSQLLATDKRLGADPLLCLLYETDSHEENENVTELHNMPRVWRYRTTISLQQLRQEVEASCSNKREHRVLKLFLDEEHRLRAIRYIPSILHLHRVLLNKYYKKIDKTEASRITYGMLVQEQIAGVETETLLQDFSHAWELVRKSLEMYLCPTEFGGKAVPKEFCNLQMSDKTPLSMLLPTEKEIGLCSYALLDFLLRSQNAFLDKYKKEANRHSTISKVLPKDVSSAHLICFDPQRDLLPLVLANCHYSFEMGDKNTKIEYDLTGLERQLMDRFLFSKSMIDVGSFLMIDTMVYRTEITDATVFKKLEKKIPQVMLDSTVMAQICSDIRQLPELWQALTNLDIAISFVKTTGGRPEQNLHDFMIKTLQMESSISSRKAQQLCEFQHIKSLWLLLSLQKAKKMADSDKGSMSIFESVPQEFHDDIPEELLTTLTSYIQSLSVERLTELVEAIHEFILLVVAVKQNMDDIDAMTTVENKIGEWLMGYMDSFDNPCIDLAILGDFPNELLFKHSIRTWVISYSSLKGKMKRNAD